MADGDGRFLHCWDYGATVAPPVRRWHLSAGGIFRQADTT